MRFNRTRRNAYYIALKRRRRRRRRTLVELIIHVSGRRPLPPIDCA